jgi:serine/threonine protein kinase
MLQTQRTEESIFVEALNKSSPSERAAFLDDVCEADGALRARVENLLSSHENAGSFLNERPLPPGDTTDIGRLTEVAGTVIGRYKLLQPIGEGGFGVVYMAEQKEPVRRKVALKIIKLGMDSKEVIARFEAERQALALMDHPNIARVFDAGTTPPVSPPSEGGAWGGGRPYFVMELVKGVPIAEFCDKNQLPARQRLDIFTAVCQAVQHAH